MTEKLYVLGTGHAMVTHCYNTCFAIEREGKFLLVDGGGGSLILRKLEEASIPLEKISDIVLTHTHTDHFFGVIWVIRRIAEKMLSGSFGGDVTVWAHAEGIEAIKTVCGITLQKKMTDLFGSRIHLAAVLDGERAEILGNAVRFFDIRSTKLIQYGFEMTLSDKKRLVCLGDEPCNVACEHIVENADWLLCEAFCRWQDREEYRPYEKHHATVRDSCELAERLSVRRLVLWHSEEDTLVDRPTLYAAEGREYFGGELFVPRDGEVIPL